jgi:hypothetical protein
VGVRLLHRPDATATLDAVDDVVSPDDGVTESDVVTESDERVEPAPTEPPPVEEGEAPEESRADAPEVAWLDAEASTGSTSWLVGTPLQQASNARTTGERAASRMRRRYTRSERRRSHSE